MKKIAVFGLFLAGAIAGQVPADYCASLGLESDDEVRTAVKDEFQFLAEFPHVNIFHLETAFDNFKCIPPRVFSKFSQEEFNRLRNMNSLVVTMLTIEHIAPDAFATRAPLVGLSNFQLHDAPDLFELPTELLHSMPNLERFLLSNTAVSDLKIGQFEKNQKVTKVQLHFNKNMVTIPQELSRFQFYEILNFLGCENMDFPAVSPLQGALVKHIDLTATKMASVDLLNAMRKLGIVDDYCGSRGFESDDEVRTAVKDQFQFLFPQSDFFFLGTTLDNFKCIPPRVFSKFSQEEFNRLRNMNGLVVRMLTIQHIARDAFATRAPLVGLSHFQLEDAPVLFALPIELLHSMPNLEQFLLSNTGVFDLRHGQFEKNQKVTTVQLHFNKNMVTIPQELSRFPFYEILDFFGCENMDFPDDSPLKGTRVDHITFSSTKMDAVNFFEAVEKLGIILV